MTEEELKALEEEDKKGREKMLKEIAERKKYEVLSYGKMMGIIARERLDEGIDFQMNSSGSTFGSVRLNQEPDGKYVLYTVGDRGVEYKSTFDNPENAYYEAVELLRQLKQRNQFQ